uniref:Uncharacterized protein n=1 Tax=Tanacetum cinerariifolium TaxID=118510 RepID=A0A6L2NH07_TANCI|nr:hypothetical protein [Tanacetum cinerariifolium]
MIRFKSPIQAIYSQIKNYTERLHELKSKSLYGGKFVLADWPLKHDSLVKARKHGRHNQLTNSVSSIPDDSTRSAASVSNNVKERVKILTQGNPQARKHPFQKALMLRTLILSEIFGSDADHFSNDAENPNDYT